MNYCRLGEECAMIRLWTWAWCPREEMIMTKREAKAILRARKRILAALVDCQAVLKGDELLQFQSYWGAHIRNAMEGQGYGSALIYRAEMILGGLRE